MKVDFIYDGEYLSDYGMTICDFDSASDTEVVTAGSELNWNQVPVRHGDVFLTTNSTYDNVLETTFQICKFSCHSGGIEPLEYDEQRALFRWLNRKEPHMLKIIDDEDVSYAYVGFEGSFNISKIEIAGQIYGYELHFVSNRPFAIGDLVKEYITVTADNLVHEIRNDSDEIGFIYPKSVRITCRAAGDLKIVNTFENRETIIKGCANGEIITFDEFFNITDSPSNEIQDRFNFIFFRIANSYRNNKNIITFSIPCEFEFQYYPIVKGVSL